MTEVARAHPLGFPFRARYEPGMAFQNIRLDISPAAIATITLDRPESLNALNAGMIEEMRAALASLPGSGARCLLLTGEGRAFSSGADLVAGGGLPRMSGPRWNRT